MISIWEKETFFAPQDIIIVGSGFSGLWAALSLKKKNKKLKITIVDRGIIPEGASTRNAGFACFGSLTELLADEQRSGSDKMLQLVEMRYKGLQRIQKTFSPGSIGLDRCGGYELFTKEEQYKASDLQLKAEYLNDLLKPIVKNKKAYKLADQKIRQFGFKQTAHLVKNNLEGYLHVGKLVEKLLQKVQSAGVRVLNNVEITGIEKNRNITTLQTNHPFSLQAQKVLICTNGFAKNLLPELDVEPVRGQVLLTSPIKNLQWKGTFHYNEGFYYFRNLGNRVLLGGARNKAMEEEKTVSFETTSVIQNELESFLKTIILPGKSFTIDQRWSGIMGVGSEKMPIVKQISPTIFCSVRMSGMGVALAPLLGEQIAGMMLQ